MSLGTKYSEKGADILVELQVDKKKNISMGQTGHMVENPDICLVGLP